MFRMLINGELVDGEGGSFPVVNPSTAAAFAQCPQASRAQVDAAIDGAAKAFPLWAATPIEQRKKHLAGALEAYMAATVSIAVCVCV